MPDDVGIVVSTFGDRSTWEPLARRALQSAFKQTTPTDKITWVHHETLHQARNKGAAEVDSEWLIFLDADDELDEHYIEAMLETQGDIRRPSTLGIYEDGTVEAVPSMIPAKDIRKSNYIVIGAMCSHEIFDKVGGFRDFSSLEDWDLWRRMILSGATVSDVPGATYRIHVRSNSRNADSEVHNSNYRRIIRGE